MEDCAAPPEHGGGIVRLEEQVLKWHGEESGTVTLPRDEEAIHRFLQLARREGMKAGFVDPDAPLAEDYAKKTFPIRRAVAQPREVQDSSGAVFRVVGGDLFMKNGTGWSSMRAFATAVSAERVRLWSDLFANPTVTREVEE